MPLQAVLVMLVVIAALSYIVYSRTVFGSSADFTARGAALALVWLGLWRASRVLKR